MEEEWHKINQNLNNILEGAEGTITMQSATWKDEGFCQCFARNQYGTALSITIHLQMAILDFSSALPVLKKTAQEGMPFYIQIAPHKSFPKSIYSWHTVNNTFDLNARTIQPTKRIKIADNGKAELFSNLATA